MSAWTIDDLRRLDWKYTEEGIVVHQRTFRTAMELFGSGFVMGVVRNSDVKSIDGACVASPRGATDGPQPHRPGKLACKRHLILNRRGVPLALSVTGANRHDSMVVVAVQSSL